ncbi:hypothetical protein J6590_003323 [Homalodisca vitripennis]|nr:hypothetical protein J6590_003323 [Homalodisca vitripennis]
MIKLVDVVEDEEGFDMGESSLTVFLDLSKAFDCIQHVTLLYEFVCCGVHGLPNDHVDLVCSRVANSLFALHNCALAVRAFGCSLVSLTSDKNKVQCKSCRGYFHWSCVKLTEAEIEVFAATNTAWNCDACTKKKRVSRSFSDSSSVSASPSKMSVSIEDIKSLLEEMKKEILQGQTNLESELGKSLVHCSEGIAENNRLIESQQKRIEEQQEAISSLQEENNRLRVQVKELSNRQVDLEQYSRRNTLEIFGVPEGPNETSEALKRKVVEIGTALGATLSEAGIDACHRINGGSNRPTSGIIVKFLRRDDREKEGEEGLLHQTPVWLSAGLSGVRQPVLGTRKKGTICEGPAGRVKVRKSDDKASRVIVINNEDELAGLVGREAKGS